MSRKLWDVIIVGGGPAGVTAALRLAGEPLDVLLVEAAEYPGAENWSGAVYFAENLADAKVLGADELARAPYERRVVKRGVLMAQGPVAAGMEYRNEKTFRHCYTVLRPVYDRYLAELARQRGVALLNRTTVDGLIRDSGRVIGVHTDRGPLYANLVFLAEGDASNLVTKEGFEREAVTSRPNGGPKFLQGVKEVIALEPDVIQDRFGLGPDEAACYEVLLRNPTLGGRAVRLNMAGFIYTNRSSVSIGLVLPLDNLARFRGGYNTLMEWFKALPSVRPWIEGGESISYGAKVIRGGGAREIPRLTDHGVAIGGAATGIGVDFPYPNFTGPATYSGRLFAEAALELHASGEPASVDLLDRLYAEPLRDSHHHRNVERLRDWPDYIERTEILFGRAIDLISGTAYLATRPELRNEWKGWHLARHVGDSMRGHWRAALADARAGLRALGVSRRILKHLPGALLMAIPNTLFALVPFGWGRPVGRFRFVARADDGRVAPVPMYLRWLGARLSAPLSAAAHALYVNDDRPLADRLDEGVGRLMRSLSLWELGAAAAVAVAYPLARGAQYLVDLARRAVGAARSDRRGGYYGRFRARCRAALEIADAGPSDTRSHDAKLGDITYLGRPDSHIRVFFPPDGDDRLDDPSASSLWNVCPAAVYQVNLDRTLHASATVNFENCVKCESCWRIEPRHVDWTRFGPHRLIYEVYTDADGPLRRLIAGRGPDRARDVAADYWSIALGAAGTSGGRTAAPGLERAMRAAGAALARVRAHGDRVSEEVWAGPRVLQPGQVEAQRERFEYLAALLDELCESVRADAIATAAGDLDLSDRLEGLAGDIERQAAAIRRRAAARRYFAAEADVRLLRDHHLPGLDATLARVARGFGLRAEILDADPLAAIRRTEETDPAREAARARLRERLAAIFDRGAIRRLEHGGALERAEIDLLGAIARAALDAEPRDPEADPETEVAAATAAGLDRADLLAELARVDASLATLVAGHVAAVDALEAAGAPAPMVADLRAAERFALVVTADEAAAASADADAPGGSGPDATDAPESWAARFPLVAAALADLYVVAGPDRIAAFDRRSPGLTLEPVTAIGLYGAGVAELSLDGARGAWEAEWPETAAAELFSRRARDLTAIAFGVASLMAGRALEHARGRVQFPDHFQDLDGRDSIGKFGAVRAMLARIETDRLLIETLCMEDGASAAPHEAALAKAAVTAALGPGLDSITYLGGQVIGGTAFSEDDVISKMYRDAAVLPYQVRANADIERELGAAVTAAVDRATPLGALASERLSALGAAAARPILGAEIGRLVDADEKLRSAIRTARGRAGDDPAAAEALHEVIGGLVVGLYGWARLLERAHGRLEAALPVDRHVGAVRCRADDLEERLVAVEDELKALAGRIALGGRARDLGAYPDAPIASEIGAASYERDIVGGNREYRWGDFLLRRLDAAEPRHVPELVWADETLRSHYTGFVSAFRERYIEPGYDPPFDRHVEALHHIPAGHIDWTREQGYFRMVIPKELGGQGRWKADYYNLCMVARRHADVSHALTIQVNTSIGTTPILIGLFQDIPEAESDLRKIMAAPERVAKVEAELRRLIEAIDLGVAGEIEPRFRSVAKDARASLGRSRVLKKAVFGRTLDALDEADRAVRHHDLAGLRRWLARGTAALEGWRARARAEIEEIPRRQLAHEYFLHLIAVRMISGFALTEPSAGSDTARIRTEAKLERRRVHRDPDGVRYFYLDEETRTGRRNLCDLMRFDFEGGRIAYRYSDEAEPAEVVSHEYSYREDTPKHRYYMHGERRVDIHDIAMVREDREGEYYEFYVLNGAKMWITNGHIAGVLCLYARTPLGPTGFMVDAHAEGFFVGRDEEKMGQRGSPTNEITLDRVRVPRECIIGVEGRGQENALETLNVGRAGLCVTGAAGMQQMMTDARDFAAERALERSGRARYRLALALEEMFATEAIAFQLIGRFDDPTTDTLRMESAIGKLFATDGTHRVLEHLEPIYGIEGRTARHRIEKDRRDARVLTIYEGTNEIQQFLLLKDLIDTIASRWREAGPVEISEGDETEWADELRALGNAKAELRDRVLMAHEILGSAAWQRAMLQPVFFPLSRMTAWTLALECAVYRGVWIAHHLTAPADAGRREALEAAARGFVRRAGRELRRLAHAFDRDFARVRRGGATAALDLAETVLDAADEPHARIEDAPATGPGPDRDLHIAVVAIRVPRLAPRPRLRDGRVEEHLYTFAPGDRRALNLALDIRRARPDRVRVIVVCVGGPEARDDLRGLLAAGADRALLLDSAGAAYTDHAIARAAADTLAAGPPDLVLAAGRSEQGGGGGLAGHLAAALDCPWLPGVSRIELDGSSVRVWGERLGAEPLAARTPLVLATLAPESEPEPEFTAPCFVESLRRSIERIELPSDAERVPDEIVPAAASNGADEDGRGRVVEPDRAASILLAAADLADGASPSLAHPFNGTIRECGPAELELGGVVLLVDLTAGDLARGAAGAIAVARSIAAHTGLPCTALALGAAADEDERRERAGRLLRHGAFDRVVLVDDERLASGSFRAHAEALVRLLGPGSPARAAYLVASPRFADALPALAWALRGAGRPVEELPGVTRVELREGGRIELVRSVTDRRLRARRLTEPRGAGLRLLWCEAEAEVQGADPDERASTPDPEVLRVALELDYDPREDELARAIADAAEELGLVTLENAEFIIDVGAGLGSGEHLETLVQPLRRALLELGAPHVEIGASRKVTQDLNWLPDDRQIGQTGVRVNPRVLIALGVSGAPQHLDYIGERAVIFAFNLDPNAPIMTLNERRPRPRVYPIIGDLFETVPEFVAALGNRAG